MCGRGDTDPPAQGLPRQEAGRVWAPGLACQCELDKVLCWFSNHRMFATHFSFTVSSLKMCTVSVLLEAERNMPSMLKASEQMLTHLRAG